MKRKLRVTELICLYQHTERIQQKNKIIMKKTVYKSKHCHRRDLCSSSESEDSECDDTECKEELQDEDDEDADTEH